MICRNPATCYFWRYFITFTCMYSMAVSHRMLYDRGQSEDFLQNLFVNKLILKAISLYKEEHANDQNSNNQYAANSSNGLELLTFVVDVAVIGEWPSVKWLHISVKWRFFKITIGGIMSHPDRWRYFGYITVITLMQTLFVVNLHNSWHGPNLTVEWKINVLAKMGYEWMQQLDWIWTYVVIYVWPDFSKCSRIRELCWWFLQVDCSA